MGTQASVQSIDALKDFRTALALFTEDALAALGAVDMEIRRTVQWLEHDRPGYWEEQIKRRRELVSAARAEVFRRKLAKTADYSPAYTEQKELLRRAEEGLHDAEMRALMVRRWKPALQQAVLEYHASIRRIKDLASGEVPRAVALLERLIDALEAYLRVALPTGPEVASSSEAVAAPDGSFDSIAATMLAAEPEPAPTSEAEPEPGTDGPAPNEPSSEAPPAPPDAGPTP
jgi:hypothetical protein